MTFPAFFAVLKVSLTLFYLFLLFLISFLILYKIKLLVTFFLTRPKTPIPAQTFQKLPFVTIQLPIFNEVNVVERLLASAAAVDYPRDQFEIQVLDDSTDETLALSKTLARQYREKGFRVSHFHRTDRRDFKAGALAAGLKKARGNFVAIFDSDFIIPRDFLKKSVHFFTDPKTGMVQCRWGFINENQTLLTRLQATFLNGHFIVEHTARNRGGHFFNFNGTAGIWRKQAIQTSGGWQGDTLTEDLDLSYRSQLNQWKFVFLKDLTAPSELPPTLDSFFGQQFRWVKGMCQVFFKILGRIWKSPATLGQKLDASCHLMSGVGYVNTILVSILVVPVLWLARDHVGNLATQMSLWVIGVNSLLIFAFYFVAQTEASGYKWKSFTGPLLVLVFSIGFSLNGTLAVIEAVLGKQSPFIRTPKFNKQQRKRIAGGGPIKKVHGLTFLFVLYFSFLTVTLLTNQKFSLLPALFFFSAGHFWVFGIMVKERFARA